MLQRGARHFVFIGRSGTDKPAAKNLVHDLETAGANVVVVRGDVGSYADVERTVSEASRPIGGVVQAAMSVHVSFSPLLTSHTHRPSGRILQRDVERDLAHGNQPESSRNLESA